MQKIACHVSNYYHMVLRKKVVNVEPLEIKLKTFYFHLRQDATQYCTFEQLWVLVLTLEVVFYVWIGLESEEVSVGVVTMMGPAVQPSCCHSPQTVEQAWHRRSQDCCSWTEVHLVIL